MPGNFLSDISGLHAPGGPVRRIAARVGALGTVRGRADATTPTAREDGICRPGRTTMPRGYAGRVRFCIREPMMGSEPTTFRLQGECSNQAELHWHGMRRRRLNLKCCESPRTSLAQGCAKRAARRSGADSRRAGARNSRRPFPFSSSSSSSSLPLPPHATGKAAFVS